DEFRIYRAGQAAGPFTNIVTLPANVTNYTDAGLQSGWLYFYEVAAVYGGREVHSAPVAILSFLNNNLIANGGFEENDNSHWDKWFTGDIPWSRMTGNTNVSHEGRQSMEIQLSENGGGGSISQFGQYGIPDSTIFVTPGALYSFGGFFRSGGISQPSQHWLEWSSTPTAQDTNARPTRPYPDYFTPYFNIGTNAVAWSYADRAFILPAGFSNMELTHRYTIDSPGSGSVFIDDVFLRRLPAPGNSSWVKILPFGSAWRYFTNAPPANWQTAAFDDSLWPQGKAKLGCGSGPANLVTPLPPAKPAYYFRSAFNVPATNLEEFLLSATCTDNGAGPSLQIYLNGRAIPATDIAPVSLQGNETNYYDLTPFLDFLHPGANTIAVVLNNVFAPTWDDVAFDLDLKVMPASVVPIQPRISALQSDSTGVTLSLGAPVNTIWRVESSDFISPAPQWQLVGIVTNLSTNVFLLRDTGQNGRKNPQSVTARYYRMVPN
ncbi:MAG TPA: hypothetical protein VH598_10095, partial [Verrucomicrobiae bacterium]|nr:hypothetical protein [Verrucomicrobiae bacterium]